MGSLIIGVYTRREGSSVGLCKLDERWEDVLRKLVDVLEGRVNADLWGF